LGCQSSDVTKVDFLKFDLIKPITYLRASQRREALENLRSKLVATKEGGGITGEEKFREQMGSLYGAVNGYECRPTQSQINRLTALGKELEAVMAEFEALSKKELVVVNAALETKKIDSIKLMTKAD